MGSSEFPNAEWDPGQRADPRWLAWCRAVRFQTSPTLGSLNKFQHISPKFKKIKTQNRIRGKPPVAGVVQRGQIPHIPHVGVRPGREKLLDARYAPRRPPSWRRGFRVQGLGCKVQGSGFRVWGVGFRVLDSGFGVVGTGSRVWGLGRKVQGLLFKV